MDVDRWQNVDCIKYCEKLQSHSAQLWNIEVLMQKQNGDIVYTKVTLKKSRTAHNRSKTKGISDWRRGFNPYHWQLIKLNITC